MKQLLINLVCCLGLVLPLQAQDSLTVLIPDQFYTDTHNPFLDWKEEPASFQFTMYDRWGNLIVSTDKNPHFILDDLLDKKKTKLSDLNTYFILLEFTGSDGTKRKSTRQSTYLGFYCSG